MNNNFEASNEFLYFPMQGGGKRERRGRREDEGERGEREGGKVRLNAENMSKKSGSSFINFS